MFLITTVLCRAIDETCTDHLLCVPEIGIGWSREVNTGSVCWVLPVLGIPLGAGYPLGAGCPLRAGCPMANRQTNHPEGREAKAGRRWRGPRGRGSESGGGTQRLIL